MILSDRAVAAMAREDAEAEALAKRNGWMTEGDCYGFVNVSRNVLTGAVQSSQIFATRAEALQAAHAKRAKGSKWIHESTDRVRTVAARAAA